MTRIVFEKHDGKFLSVRVSGHSGYADAGKDIVCAAVSSALDLSISYILDVFKMDCVLVEDEEKAEIYCERGNIPEDKFGLFSDILFGLYSHFHDLSSQYPKYVSCIITEV